MTPGIPPVPRTERQVSQVPSEPIGMAGSSPSWDDAGSYPFGQRHGMAAADMAARGARLPRGFFLLIAGAALLIVVLAIRQFAELAAPVVLALVLVIAVHPLAAVLRRRGLPQWLASSLTVLATLALILGLAGAIAFSLARLATLLPTYQDRFVELVDNTRSWLASLGIGQDEITTAVDQIDYSRVADLFVAILAGFAQTFSDLLFLLFVITFMALDASGFADRLSHLRRQHPDLLGALDTFVRGTRRYLLVATVFGLIVAVVDAGFLWLVGVPLPLLWGLLAFITNYIPNVGFIIGLIPPALLALLEGGPGLMAAVIVAYAVINFVIQSVIQPRVVGDRVGLTPTITFVSLVFWAWALGALGALLAVPLSILTRALLVEADPAARWALPLISGKLPPTEPASQPSREPPPEASPGVTAAQPSDA